MRKRFTIKVKPNENCVVYSNGGQINFIWPEIVEENTSRICSHAVNSLGNILKNIDDVKGIKTFSCEKCNNQFEITFYDPVNTMVLKREEVQAKPEYVEKLRMSKMFCVLPITTICRIASLMKMETVPKGTEILLKGELGSKFSIVSSGEVEIIEYDSSGNESIIAKLKENDCFGEMSLITGDMCSATVKSTSEVELLSLSRENFNSIIRENPKLYMYFTKLLSERLNATNKQTIKEIESGVIGKLNMISLAEIIQALYMSNRTGLLNVVSGKQRAEIMFNNGQIINSIMGDEQGEEPLYEVLAWKNGNFKFEQKEINPDDRVIHADTMGLLMEGMRRIDEIQSQT